MSFWNLRLSLNRLQYTTAVRLFQTSCCWKANGKNDGDPSSPQSNEDDVACEQKLDKRASKKCTSALKSLSLKSSVCTQDPPICKNDQLCVVDPAPAICQEDISPKPPSRSKVVIIGAGISGLTAANRLLENCVDDVTILESTYTCGGMIQTKWFGDTVVDLGGELPCADEQNDSDFWNLSVVYQAEKAGLIRHPVTKQAVVESLLTQSDGSSLPLPVSMLALDKMKRILCVGESLKLTASYLEKGKTIDYVGMRMRQELSRFPSDMRASAAKVMTAIVILATDKIPIVKDTQAAYCSVPGSGLKIPFGCGGFIGPLLKRIKPDMIKYGTEVQTVCWGTVPTSSGRRAIVKTVDGQEITANYVIYTPSLGVLKERVNTFFCPSLPGFKAEAIKNTEFLLENKMFLRFREPVWSWRDDPIDVIFDANDMSCATNWLKGLRKIREIRGSQTVLRVDLAGEGSCLMEHETDQDIILCFRSFLSKYIGNPVPDVTDILRTSYYSDTNFRGSRASSGDYAEELAVALPSCVDPAPPVLFFAGSSTSTSMPGTVAGAIASGIREADKVLAIMERLADEPEELPAESARQ